ncbi:FecR family protein [Draconibacterium sediminis]|uniref:FecR family protein n=1 Tax=Draconibacterium sediminis TaxID=1544798 RepID=UPI0026EB17AE|nr:FecR domain-containing protein [Draconibacterium sediminis]
MPTESKIGNTIVDYFLKEELGIDEDKMNTWLDESIENKTKLNEFKTIWRTVDTLCISKQFNVEEGWIKVNQSIFNQVVIMGVRKNVVFSIAGMTAILLIILGFLFLSNPSVKLNNRIELATSYGNQTESVLPDGTKVYLNSGSNLSYHYNDKDKIREVEFNGEAFFEVAKNEKPFVIETNGGMKIEVLGTKFNLMAYCDDENIITALIEGKVEISNQDGQKVNVLPGQIVEFEKETENMKMIPGNANLSSAWREHKIYLDNSSLASITKILERMYNVQIYFNPPEIGEQIHYTGVLQEETIIDVLNALKELSDICFKQKGKEIIIMSN